jgi:hypothetical protein
LSSQKVELRDASWPYVVATACSSSARAHEGGACFVVKRVVLRCFLLANAFGTRLISFLSSLFERWPASKISQGGAFSEERKVAIPTRVHVSGDIDLIYYQHPEAQLRVAVEDASDLAGVSTRVESGVLVIDRALSPASAEGRRVVVGVTSPALSSITASGDSTVEITYIDREQIHIVVSDAAEVLVNGVSEILAANVTGGGILDARSLRATNAHCRVQGRGRLAVTALGHIHAHVTDTGLARVYGNPPRRDESRLNAGRIMYS